MTFGMGQTSFVTTDRRIILRGTRDGLDRDNGESPAARPARPGRILYTTGIPVKLDRDSLDQVARDLLLPAVVKARGAGISMSGQGLHITQRHALVQQVGDGGDAE